MTTDVKAQPVVSGSLQRLAAQTAAAADVQDVLRLALLFEQQSIMVS